MGRNTKRRTATEGGQAFRRTEWGSLRIRQILPACAIPQDSGGTRKGTPTIIS
jgi:hypothetical protein